MYKSLKLAGANSVEQFIIRHTFLFGPMSENAKNVTVVLTRP